MQSNVFTTTDVDLAAFLVCRGHRVTDVLPPASPPPWLATFEFESSARLAEDELAWEQPDGSRLVDARDFAKHRIRLYRRARNQLDAVRAR